MQSVKCVGITKCVKVRALFVTNKVRFARAEQLWLKRKNIQKGGCDLCGRFMFTFFS